jgi:hypothetical protein
LDQFCIIVGLKKPEDGRGRCFVLVQWKVGAVNGCVHREVDGRTETTQSTQKKERLFDWMDQKVKG